MGLVKKIKGSKKMKNNNGKDFNVDAVTFDNCQKELDRLNKQAEAVKKKYPFVKVNFQAVVDLNKVNIGML
jgi:hypothetical protein